MRASGLQHRCGRAEAARGARSPVFTSAAAGDCGLSSSHGGELCLSLFLCVSRLLSCSHLPLCLLFFFFLILISKKDPRCWESAVPLARPARPPHAPLFLRIVLTPAPLTRPVRLPRLLLARRAAHQLEPWLGYCCRLWPRFGSRRRCRCPPSRPPGAARMRAPRPRPLGPSARAP